MEKTTTAGFQEVYIQKRADELLSSLRAQLPKGACLQCFDPENVIDGMAVIQIAKKSRKVGFRTLESEQSITTEFQKTLERSSLRFSDGEEPIIFSKKLCINLNSKEKNCASYKYFIITNTLRLICLHVTHEGTRVEYM